MATIKKFGKEYSYVLKEEHDKPEAEQTVWWYKLADLDDQQASVDIIEFEGDPNDKETLRTIYKPNIKAQARILLNCLTRVENLKNDDGESVEWPKANQYQKQFLASLPPAWRAELAGVFRQASTVSEDEAKN